MGILIININYIRVLNIRTRTNNLINFSIYLYKYIIYF
jgi:hypothetical protein